MRWLPFTRRHYVFGGYDGYLDVVDRLHEHQDSLCAICGEAMTRDRTSGPALATIDHVIPRSRGGWQGWGNIVLTHAGCNRWKADTFPTGCELVWLLAVNAREGVNPRRW